MAKLTAKLEGNKVLVTRAPGGQASTFVCKDRATAAALREAIDWLQTMPAEITATMGYRNDSWGSTLPEHNPERHSEVKRLVLRWNDAGVIQRVAVTDGTLGRDKIRAQWDAEEAAARKEEGVMTEDKIPKNGFISKPVYRVEPKNRKSYWFAERYQDGKKSKEDMRCANKAVAEALCASDMRLGYARSCMDTGHFYEAGDRYIRMEQAVVTECYDAGDAALNRAYFDKRRDEYGPVKYKEGIADPDPEPTAEAKPEARKDAVLRAEMDDAAVNKAAEALQKLSQELNKEDIKRAFNRTEDARVNADIAANVKQVQSNETNKENPVMANNEKPVTDTKPVARVPSQIELEARAAALRTGMKQLTKLIHEPLAAALAAQLTPPGSDPSAMKAQVAAFLKSELGSAVVSAMLSLAINSIPANMIPGFTAERQSLVAQELRVKAMTEVGDTLVDLVAAPLRAALAGLMTGPAAEALTGVRAEDAGLDGASTAQEEAPAVAQTDNVKKVNFG